MRCAYLSHEIRRPTTTWINQNDENAERHDRKYMQKTRDGKRKMQKKCEAKEIIESQAKQPKNSSCII